MTNHSGDTVNASQPFEKQYITSLQPGAILWLPRRERMPDGVYIDPDIQDGAFNHPCVVLSIPSKVNIESVIEIAYVSHLLSFLLIFRNGPLPSTLLFLINVFKNPMILKAQKYSRLLIHVILILPYFDILCYVSSS